MPRSRQKGRGARPGAGSGGQVRRGQVSRLVAVRTLDPVRPSPALIYCPRAVAEMRAVDVLPGSHLSHPAPRRRVSAWCGRGTVCAAAGGLRARAPGRAAQPATGAMVRRAGVPAAGSRGPCALLAPAGPRRQGASAPVLPAFREPSCFVAGKASGVLFAAESVMHVQELKLRIGGERRKTSLELGRF